MIKLKHLAVLQIPVVVIQKENKTWFFNYEKTWIEIGVQNHQAINQSFLKVIN